LWVHMFCKIDELLINIFALQIHIE
jgi:hypothetical protein